MAVLSRLVEYGASQSVRHEFLIYKMSGIIM